jgi:chromate reductase
MKKVLAFGASNSKQSINQQLATWAANQIEDIELKTIDLNDFEMPIYSIDRENTSGIPQQAHNFKRLIMETDGIIISFAEHNGSFSAAYKNITDWTSLE